MTFHEAQIHCSKLNSTIFSPLNNAEIEELLKEKNIMEKQYIIWTDFERINMTHFRSKSDERYPSISRNKIHHLYYTSANDFEIEAQKWFYNIVVANGNGTILNIPT